MSSTTSELDFLRAIVGLVRVRSLGEGLDVLLENVLGRSGAEYGYIEVSNERIDNASVVWRARTLSDEHLGWIQHVISRGIIALARVEGRTLATPSAVNDARFRDCESVKQHEIGAVLCAPFEGFWTSGVVYVQGDPGGGSFDATAIEAVEITAFHAGQLAERVRREAWPRTPLRVEIDALERHFIEEACVRNDFNLSAVHRETGVPPKITRRIMRRRRDNRGR
jgi:GAF domain-containing protein